MADVAQYIFSLKEVTTALIKAQGIKDGTWMVGFEFGFGAANIGPSPTEIKPSTIVSINNFILLKVKDGEQVPPFAVDAASVS